MQVIYTFIEYPIVYGFMAIGEIMIGTTLSTVLISNPEIRATMAMLSLPIVIVALMIL